MLNKDHTGLQITGFLHQYDSFLSCKIQSRWRKYHVTDTLTLVQWVLSLCVWLQFTQNVTRVDHRPTPFQSQNHQTQYGIPKIRTKYQPYTIYFVSRCLVHSKHLNGRNCEKRIFLNCVSDSMPSIYKDLNPQVMQ